jgi:signal transduction histidine kinase
VIAELRASYPASQIEAHFELTQKVDCDGGRIAQLFSNLLGNALTDGTPVRIQGTGQGRRVRVVGCPSRRSVGAGDPVHVPDAAAMR